VLTDKLMKSLAVNFAALRQTLPKLSMSRNLLEVCGVKRMN
jgi:hypothetical protein